MKQIITIFLCGITWLSIAQENDLLVSKYQSDKTAQIVGSLQKGVQFINENKGDSAIYQFIHTLNLSHIYQQEQWFDSTLNLLVAHLPGWSNYIDSGRASLLEDVLAWGKQFKIKNSSMLELHYRLGCYYSDQNKLNFVIHHFNFIEQYTSDSLTTQDSLLKAKTLSMLTPIWIQLGDLEQAQHYRDKLHELYLSSSDPHIGIYNALAKGKYHLFFQEYDNYEKELLKGLGYSHDLTCRCGDNIKAHLCEVYFMTDQAQRGIDTLKIVIRNYLDNENQLIQKGFFPIFKPKIILFYQFLLGLGYSRTDRFKQAEQIFITILEENNLHFILKMNTLKYLAEAYLKQHKYHEASERLLQLVNLFEDKKVVEEKNQTFAVKHKIDKAKALEQKNFTILQQQYQLSRTRFIIAGIVVLVSALFFLIFIRSKSLKNKQKLQALQAKLEGEETARKQIAQELHDGVGSQLLISRLSLSNILEKNNIESKDIQEIQSTLKQLEQISKQIRATSHSLMPDYILQQGLIYSVAAYLEEIETRNLLKVDFQTLGNPPLLSESITIQLFRIIQECIQNVLKHAEATKLIVLINSSVNLLHITIQDNGKGFNPHAKENKGMGLNTMQIRMEDIGGGIEIESRPEKGCAVYLELDLLTIKTKQ